MAIRGPYPLKGLCVADCEVRLSSLEFPAEAHSHLSFQAHLCSTPHPRHEWRMAQRALCRRSWTAAEFRHYFSLLSEHSQL